MDLTELLGVLWRRKAIIIVVLAIVLGGTAAFLELQPKVYESTATIGLTPRADASGDDSQQLLLFSQIDVITPLYAEAVTAKETAELAQEKMPSGTRMGAVSVRSFRDAPLILKISARSGDPEVARQSASAVIEALFLRSERGEISSPPLLSLVQINRPQANPEPVTPRPKLTWIIGSILGLGLACGAALTADTVLRKVDTAEELSAVMGAPVFGEVPIDRNIARLRSSTALAENKNLRVASEALRDLRTNMQFSSPDLSSILVTSPEGRHGKTTISFGLAVSFARAGARTLLIDGDLRRGRVEELLVEEQRAVHKSPGLWDLLTACDLRDVVQRTDLENLHVLTSGGLRDHPDEEMEAKFHSTLFQLEQLYDVIVIDGTPVLPVNDARVIAKYVTATIMVAAAGVLSKRQLRLAAVRLEIIGVQPAGLVLNRSRVRHGRGYYAYLKTSEPERPARTPRGTIEPSAPE